MRQMKCNLRLGISLAATVAAMMIAGCDDRAKNAPSAAIAESVPPDTNQRAKIAQTLPATQSNYSAIETTDDLFDSLPPQQQSLAREFYAAYDPVAIEFVTHEQLAWLRHNGYPMPDDILAASRMSDMELLRLHQQGNVMAGVFFLDRAAFNAQEIGHAERSRLNSIAIDLLVRGSPFAGYVYSRYEQSKGDGHSALAGYAWAAWLGDRRAAGAMGDRSYAIQKTGGAALQPGVVAMATINLFGTIQALNPSLLSRDHDYFPEPIL